MAATATTTVEIDNELLSRLRERSPGKSDREALERAARIQLGFETIQRAQERSAAAGVDEDEVMAEAVRVAPVAGCAPNSLKRPWWSDPTTLKIEHLAERVEVTVVVQDAPVLVRSRRRDQGVLERQPMMIRR
jgi:hypothetical protein